MEAKKSILLFLLILASLVTASLAGRHAKLMDKANAQVGAMTKESLRKFWYNKKTLFAHPRILKVKTNDYGRYDPAPALAKPHFKLIPN